MTSPRLALAAWGLATLAAATPAPAATPDPRPGAPATRHCHLVPGPPPPVHGGGNTTVTVPRIACTGPVPPPVAHQPTPEPVQGVGGGHGRHGRLPFTGADLLAWLLAGAGAVGAGALLHRAARRRAGST